MSIDIIKAYKIHSKGGAFFGFWLGYSKAEALKSLHSESGYQCEVVDDALVFQSEEDAEHAGRLDSWTVDEVDGLASIADRLQASELVSTYHRVRMELARKAAYKAHDDAPGSREATEAEAIYEAARVAFYSAREASFRAQNEAGL